ncbi:hypothetical protein [Collinsella sp. CM84Y_54]|uniref:hypothetical protein n=1 Tax=Collinsella sp. CM84Y_54 TaxID=3085309 RepID=UPI002E77CDF7|nr:hypothetical protein [Collinsella sp. CM84Y_54]
MIYFAPMPLILMYVRQQLGNISRHLHSSKALRRQMPPHYAINNPSSMLKTPVFARRQGTHVGIGGLIRDHRCL